MLFEELLEELRTQGYFNIKDVQYAILETDGNLSVVPAASYDSSKTSDFKHLPLPVIIDGKIVKDNLKEYILELIEVRFLPKET